MRFGHVSREGGVVRARGPAGHAGAGIGTRSLTAEKWQERLRCEDFVVSSMRRETADDEITSVDRKALRADRSSRSTWEWSEAPRGPDDLPRKEVIQPHLPVRLPCYDFVPVTSPALGDYFPEG